MSLTNDSLPIELRTEEERELWKAEHLAVAGIDPGVAELRADIAVRSYRLRTPAPALPEPLKLEDAIAIALRGHTDVGPLAALLAREVIRLMGGE